MADICSLLVLLTSMCEVSLRLFVLMVAFFCNSSLDITPARLLSTVPVHLLQQTRDPSHRPLSTVKCALATRR